MAKKMTRKERAENAKVRRKEEKIQKLLSEAAYFFPSTRPGKSKGNMGMSKHRKSGTSAKNHSVTIAMHRDLEKLNWGK